MIVSMIVAIDENNGIGNQGRIPWKISSDLKRFKSLTMGHHLIMGRKTWESIGRALPGRTNIVLSKNLDRPPENTVLKSSLRDALEYAMQSGENEAFIIGGGRIYAEALPFTERIYLSKVHAIIPADIFFPKINWDDWIIVEKEEIPASETDQYPYTFMVLEHRNERSIR